MIGIWQFFNSSFQSIPQYNTTIIDFLRDGILYPCSPECRKREEGRSVHYKNLLRVEELVSVISKK